MVNDHLKKSRGGSGRHMTFLVGAGVLCLLVSVGILSLVCIDLLKAVGGDDLRGSSAALIPLVFMGVAGLTTMIGMWAFTYASVLAWRCNYLDTEPGAAADGGGR